MGHKYSFTMDGDEVVQRMETESGEVNTSRLGMRDIVLPQMTAQAKEAKEELDGVTSATDGEKPIAPTGTPGKSCQYHLKDGSIYCTEIERRKPDGKVQHARMRDLGRKSNVLLNRKERYEEIETIRSGIENAK
jgi:hypothetical protein